MFLTTKLGGGEIPKLNIAFSHNEEIRSNHGDRLVLLVKFSKIKTILFEVHYPLPSPIGDHLGRDGMFKNCSQLRGGWTIWVVFTNYVINIIKDKSEQPKGGN